MEFLEVSDYKKDHIVINGKKDHIVINGTRNLLFLKRLYLTLTLRN